MGIAAYLFSFNRGPWLAAALDGLDRLAPGWAVTVVDDGSDDPATRAVLERRVGRTSGEGPARVMTPEAAASGRLGGLYPNMQRALEAPGPDVVLMTQDDVQPFRPLGAREEAVAARAFAEEPARAVLAMHLPMGRRQGRNRGRLRRAGALGWVADDLADRNAVRTHYCAVAVLHRGRLLERGFRFAACETSTARRVRDLGFAPMLHLQHPWLVRMPLVPTYRGRRRTLAMRLADPGGVRLFAEMGEAEAARFLAHDAARPAAEEWLRAPGLRPPFEHKAVNRSAWLRALNKAELALRGSR